MFAYIIDEPAVHLQAPEVASGGFYTGKEDVYGLSMTPLQMHTRRPIQEAHDPGGTRNRAPSRNMVLHCAVKGRRPPIPDDMPEPLVELMTSCWAHNPDDRPTAPEVLETLKSIQDKLWDEEGGVFLRQGNKASLSPLVPSPYPARFWE